MHQPRKTARQARSRATQAAILEAAARILESGGIAALTTNEIARRAGVSIGSLYQYFPNKEAILTALIRDQRRALLDQMRASLSGTGELPPEAAVDGLIQAALAHQFARPALALALEPLDHGLELEPETDRFSAEIADLTQDVVRRLRPGAGREEARDVAAICKGMIDAAARAGETGGPALAARCRRAVLGYLGQG